MALPGQMFDNMLNPAKGWPHPAALDFRAKAAAGVAIKPGMTGSLDTAGNVVLGVKRHRMGLFAFAGSDDLDVNAEGNDQWKPISPTGQIVFLVASGGYELETTEFDTVQTYARNDPLRAHTDGKLTNQTVVLFSQTNTPLTSSTAVVGLVSRGKFTNAYGKSVISFWSIWAPGNSTE
jgi:hypothetical protein